MSPIALSPVLNLVQESQNLLKQGLVDRRIYSDPEIYRLEQERVFARSWLLVGVESQVSRPGAFVESYVGEEAVIVTRNRAGEIRVLLNTCRHQGNKVCRAESGRATTFICQYHGWSYDIDGKFIGAPKLESAYGGDLRPEDNSLLAARVETYKGLIFATFNEQAPPLSEFLGDFAWLLDVMLDRPGGVEVAGNGVLRWMVKANWKFAAENSGGDLYHGDTTHKSAIDIGHDALRQYDDLSKKETTGHTADDSLWPGCTMITDQGHAVNWNELDDAALEEVRGGSALTQHVQDTQAASVELLGEYRALRLGRFNANVFPNAGFHSSAQTIHLFHPRGPALTEVWMFSLVDKDASQEVKDEVRRHADQHFGPAGFFEEDDGENWEQATAATRGVIASRLPLNLQMGLDRRRVGRRPGSPEIIEGAYNDYGQTALLERWHELMLDEAH